MAIIAHLVVRDKFTNGYIQFMVKVFSEYEHVFFTRKGKYDIDNARENQVFELESYSELRKNKVYLDFLFNAKKIIVSGSSLNRNKILCFMSNGLLHKTYFQFWGKDFYGYRNSENHKEGSIKEFIKHKFKYVIAKYIFRHAAGLIFLIDGEYEKFQEIMHVSNNHYVAPMPDDPSRPIDYVKFRSLNLKEDNSLRVIVGNSATATNRHLEVFRLLQHFKDENINIFCPLSYGDKNYAKSIIDIGKYMFGDKFHPLTDFVAKEKYLQLLSVMDIGIFFNNRQQAMGNINLLLGLGKKIYLSCKTSMWHSYLNKGFSIFAAEEISTLMFEEFAFFPEHERINNINITDSIDFALQAEKAWRVVFES